MISKKQLETLMGRLDALENGEITPMAEEIEESRVGIRKWEDKFVVGFKGKIFMEKDKELDEKVEMVNLILTKGDKDKDGEFKTFTKKVDYLEFLRNAEKITCRVLKTSRKKVVEKDGVVEVKEVGKTGSEIKGEYGMVGTGVDVPVQVVSYDEMMTVKIPGEDNLEIDVHVNYVNI